MVIDKNDDDNRRDGYDELIHSFARSLDVSAGLAAALDVASYRTLHREVGTRLDVGAGLDAALARLTPTAPESRAHIGAGPSLPDGDAELERLARRAGAHDRAALEEFLRRIEGPVVRYCRSKLVGSTGTHTADDVAQEVLLAVCEALPRYRPDGSSVMAFVFGIARFKLVDTFRASVRNRSTPNESVPESADPDIAGIMSTEAARLRAALDMLPPHHREVLALRIGFGYSSSEIAEALDTTAGAVRVTQHRALAKLRQLLADESTAGD